ncbi:cytochrome c oxidase subunit 4 isoform 1, mitochondrial-like [Homalodisca vitripennis]|uniref:cytochrome c oxidase subunit 4 isoform 1, mitochondrial-like n=1 Tax=Homalodisca vitripennis TaxID=197043 RepID=UPI001EEAEE3E|nr:cytochrome c oxidase subunit 4 isoform 1, mitochondrial-like [Homalodisca vitripennis]
MSLLLRSSRVLQRVSALNPAASYASHAPAHKEPSPIGNREVVGFGFNGAANYVDRADFPLPAIRFKTVTPDIQALREKEKGDWKKLTLEEKKQLYRASFCQTFAEMDAPTGEWKTITGCTLFFMSLALWVFMGMKLFVYPKELPPTFSEERQQAQLQRMIDISVNPVEGISSHWDYEKNDWKK